MILVAIAILVGVFFAATGRGGELAYEVADHAPLDLGPVSATDVALLRPPTALWGYNMQVTDEALERIAQAVRDRDVTIAFLQQRLADLSTPEARTTSAAPILPPGEPSGPEHLAGPPDREDRPPAVPEDSALAAEERPR
jgi:DNA helicase HerA-like ATPase